MNDYGFGYRQKTQAPTPQSQPNTPGNSNSAPELAPDMDMLRQALMAQNQAGRAGDIRASMIRPYEKKHLLSTGFDIWRSNTADKKSREATLASAQAEKSAANEQAVAQADAVYNFLMEKLTSLGMEPEKAQAQAKAGAQAVMTGMVKVEDIIPKDAKPEKPGPTQEKFDALAGIYGEEKAREMMATEYAADVPEPDKPSAKEEELQLLIDAFGEEEGKRMFASQYAGKDDGGEKLKGVADLGADNKVKLGLIKNASDLATKAKATLFDQDGKFKNMATLRPKGESSIAEADLREGLMNMLRATSGAATPEEEIIREVNAMVPTWSDTDAQAAAKMNRITGKITNLYTAITSGYAIPPELQLSGKPVSDNGLPPGFVVDN